ncbi:hypothetical protein RHGRI_023482 [Rhododendron griersonianum]|uniref:TF-B3 domain-containing protein n=1 Tax=Rhododendron griersonianum TaxID=479676 RepID=A0AAV6J7P1_9ERIC|nr:hypothetical protein RHGRI_023482 [Rhododendron griersonianum]
MADKEQQQAYPLAPANGYARSDAEAGMADSEELRRQKRKKLLIYIAAFVVFQTAIIVLFSLTVMKVKTPKFRVRSATFGNFDVQPTNPSFALNVNAQFGVKNTNFGPYKYDSNTVYFYYNDVQVGSTVIPKSKANFLSTKKINVAVDLTSANISSNTSLASDLNSGTLPLTTKSRLSGKVELMLIFKKKKSVDMNCTMDVNISTRELQNQIPPSFVKYINGVFPFESTITSPEKRSWHVELKEVDGHVYFQEGWQQFVHVNSLEFGDFLVFYYGGNAQFYVNIYGKNGCQKEVSVPSREIDREITNPRDNQTVERRKSKRLAQRFNDEEIAQKKLCPRFSMATQEGNGARKEASKVVSKFPFFEVVMNPSYIDRGYMFVEAKNPLPTDSSNCSPALRNIHPRNMVSKSRRWQSGDDGSNRPSSEAKASPHFFKIIHSSVVLHQKLEIPMKFISQYGKNLGNHVFLKVPSGAVWKVELERSNGVVWMCNGWKEFAKHYSIGYGHLLVFRYNENCKFNVLIFDTSASEIEYPVSATHGEQTNINGNGNSKIPVTEDAIEIDDSVEILGDTPCAAYNVKREEICGRGEIEKLGVQTRQKTRQVSYYRANIEKDASVKILDDSLVRDSPVSERKRANTKSGVENNSNMHEFSPDIQSKGLKLPNQKMDVKTEIETEEGTGGTSTGPRRHQSQIPVKMLSATANMNSRALERARDFKSKKPFFTVHMQPSYVSGKSSLNMPLNFVKKYLGHHHKNISLKISDGMIWSVRSYPSFVNGKRSLAWRQFARDNNLKVGDICIFELMSKGIEPRLNVTIFQK